MARTGRLSLRTSAGLSVWAWKFSRRQLVGMAGNQVKSGHAVVQNDAGSFDHDAAAETMVHALYERCPVAELVRGCDIRRIVSHGCFGSASMIFLCCSGKLIEEFYDLFPRILIRVSEPRVTAAPRFLLGAYL